MDAVLGSCFPEAGSQLEMPAGPVSSASLLKELLLSPILSSCSHFYLLPLGSSFHTEGMWGGHYCAAPLLPSSSSSPSAACSITSIPTCLSTWAVNLIILSLSISPRGRVHINGVQDSTCQVDFAGICALPYSGAAFWSASFIPLPQVKN